MADDAHDKQPSDTEFAVSNGAAAEQPAHDHASGRTSGWRRVRPRWYIAAGIAILAVAGVVIGVLVSGSSSAPNATGTIGETLHLSAADANTTGSTVPVDVTVLNPPPPGFEADSIVQVRLTNTSSTETAQITNPAFIVVDGFGTWTAPSSATLLPGVGGQIGPGQTITGTLVFPVLVVRQVLFDPGGFVVNSSGNPVTYPSEIHGTWKSAN